MAFRGATALIASLVFAHLGAQPVWAQQAPVPTVIPISGQFSTPAGPPRTGPVRLVLSLYEGKDDLTPRWVEVQQTTLDAEGQFSVLFGSTREDGLPLELFSTSPTTRWLGVAIEGEAEQPRLLLISVAYAARAAVADTLAGKAASEFVQTSTLKDNLKAALQGEGGAIAQGIAGGLHYL